MSNKILLLLGLLIIVSVPNVLAANCNGFPNFFYGDLTIDGAPADAGTNLRALINTENKGEYTTTVIGQYGQEQGDDKFAVSCQNSGQTIVFQVQIGSSWIDSDQTASCICGGVDNFDIAVLSPGIVDNDHDGSLSDVDCDDNDADRYPGNSEVCDGKDNDCDQIVDNTGDALCDDGVFCNGAETCGGVAGCQVGTAIDCSNNDLPAIGSCDNIPDDNSYTWDAAAGFTSTCDETADACTTGSYTYTHTCDMNACEAECVIATDCPATDCDNNDGCDGNGKYIDYYPVLSVCDACVCSPGVCNDFEYIGTDGDNDGVDLECSDCDDNDADIYPGNTEVCDGKDNDCDTNIDEIFTDKGNACNVGVGACQATGTMVCKQDGTGTECNAVPGTPSTELCSDGIDNDCDGQTDANDADCGQVECTVDDDCELGYVCDQNACVEKQMVCDLFYPVNLVAGWNMFGFPSCTAFAVDVGLTSIDGNYGDVFVLVNGQWLNYNPNAPAGLNTLTTLNPLQGVYIFMEQADTLIVDEDKLI